jgi:hypothetical protein
LVRLVVNEDVDVTIGAFLPCVKDGFVQLGDVDSKFEDAVVAHGVGLVYFVWWVFNCACV